jgi:hypothetical protein
MLRTLFSATILVDALTRSALTQAPDADCALPSEPESIPAALDAAITGPEQLTLNSRITRGNLAVSCYKQTTY